MRNNPADSAELSEHQPQQFNKQASELDDSLTAPDEIMIALQKELRIDVFGVSRLIDEAVASSLFPDYKQILPSNNTRLWKITATGDEDFCRGKKQKKS